MSDRSSRVRSISLSRLREILHYDPETGVWTWIVRISNAVRAGDVAGYVNPSHGYVAIGIDRRIYLAHVLAIFYMTGEWPQRDTDHRDLVRTNNRWDNLRPATHFQNMRNRGLFKNNSSGFKGVSFNKSSGKWKARITVDYHVFFLGLFNDPIAAHAAYQKAAALVHHEFARAA